MAMTYMNVLLKKDFLTLWRNKGFLVSFIVTPIILMYVFIMIQNQMMNVNIKLKSGSLVDEYFRYTTNKRV